MTEPTFPPIRRRRLLALGAAAWAGSAGVGRAEWRLPGEYRGVVLFDRWDGCTLYNGVYLSYVAEAVKEKLRPYAGQFVRLDVKSIYQPINPGDGRITSFDILEPPPGQPALEDSDGLKLKTAMLFDGRGPCVVMEASNPGVKPIEIRSAALAPTLLTKRKPRPKLSFLDPSDGPSRAAITRRSFWRSSEDKPWRASSSDSSYPYHWRIGGEPLTKSFTVDPGESRRWTMTFAPPPGEYEFVLGYDGWPQLPRTMMSRPIAFDVADADGATEKTGAILPAP